MSDSDAAHGLSYSDFRNLGTRIVKGLFLLLVSCITVAGELISRLSGGLVRRHCDLKLWFEAKSRI